MRAAVLAKRLRSGVEFGTWPLVADWGACAGADACADAQRVFPRVQYRAFAFHWRQADHVRDGS